ncbi:MAG: oxygen-independent coproporphyrinogen III oxidase [Minwuia sp.]|uniref:oxygen-independent coproporphyrinogen III oxidase n=1 Tax=Minwuia sp. TaxID=2493630 RepID=UPI003A8B504C
MPQARTDLILRHSERLIPRYTSYPTAPHFRNDFNEDQYRHWLAQIDPGRPASLYIHVPWCRTMCWYCGCNARATRNDKPVEAFLDNLLAEIDMVAASIPGRLRLQHIHWGGGSPSIVAPGRFEQVMDRIGQRFSIDSGAEIAVEVDPRQMTVPLAEAYARSGVNRASLGIQTFDVRVQLRINRLQPFDLVETAVERLRGVGIDRLNADILYGLPGQTVESAADTAARVVQLDPWRVSSFGYAHVPSMKRHQRQIREAELPGPEARLEQAEAIASVLAWGGYRQIGLDHFARTDDDLSRAQSDGQLRRNFQGYTTDASDMLIGLGPSAIGSFREGYVQNSPDLRHWMRSVEAGELPVARGRVLTPEDRMRRDIIERLMCDLTVDVGQVAHRHRLPKPDFDTSDLEEDGIVRRFGDRLIVDPNFRILTRVAAAAFDAYLAPEERRHSAAV